MGLAVALAVAVGVRMAVAEESVTIAASEVMRFDTRGFGGAVPSGTVAHWGGALAQSETWGANEAHVVYGTITIPTNLSLTVEAGAVVKFVGGGITALGPLVAKGVTFSDIADDSVGGDTDGQGWTQPFTSYVVSGKVETDVATRFRCRDQSYGFAQPGETDGFRFDTRGLEGEVPSGTVAHWGGVQTNDETWAADGVHVVYGTITVPTNVSLTVASGAVVKFVGGGITAFGPLVAKGVTFSDIADDSVGGDTDGQGWTQPFTSYVVSGKVETDVATRFRCRDQSYGFAQPGETDGFRFDTRGLEGEVPSGTIAHWGGVQTNDETWAAGGVHVVYGTITVPTNASLTVASGAVVKFVGGGITALGPLVANGATFTDLSDDSIAGDTEKNGWTLPFPSYSLDGNIVYDAQTVCRCLDTHSAFCLDGSTATFAFDTRGLKADDLAGSERHDGGTLAADATWKAGTVHVVYGTLYVPQGITLTIEAGAVVRFVGGGLTVEGTCVAKGVTFTDLDDATGGGAVREGAKLPFPSYVLAGNIETDDATVIACSRDPSGSGAIPAASRIFRLETDTESYRFAGVQREVTFSTTWDGASAVEVTETRPDGSTVTLTNGTAECEGVFLWDAGETPGLYTLRHITDTNEMSAAFYRLDGADAHDGLQSGTNTWAADTVHVLNHSVKVPAGSVLVIEPGAVVKAMPGAVLTVEPGGICVAEGVIFTSIYDLSAGGDVLADGGEHQPGTNDYSVVGYVCDDQMTEYRYGRHSLSGSITWNEEWDANRTYVIDGILTVAEGGSLSIPKGTVVKFTTDSALDVHDGGFCIAGGVIFTHVADDSVGGDTNQDGDATEPIVGGYSISGDVVDDDETEYRYTLQELKSRISENTRLRGRRVFVAQDGVTIQSGVTLSILPGTIIKMGLGKSITVNSGAVLDVQGTRSAPVVFTSILDDDWGGDTNGDGDETFADVGDWHQITGSGTVQMNYCQLLWCSAVRNEGALYPQGGDWRFNNSIVAHCEFDNMRGKGGTFVAENSMFLDGSMGAAPQYGVNQFINCVFDYLTTAVRWGYGEFRNCIFSNVTTDFIDTKYYSDTVQSKFSNCCFWGPDCTGEKASEKVGHDGNFWADPLYYDAENWDFRIWEDSPCVDAGDGSVAPKTDWYGQPHQNIAQTPTGTVDEKGKYPDIGLYEVQPRYVDADVDLTVVQVTAPEVLMAGESVMVSWTVRNLGSETAMGRWVDRVEIVCANGSAVTLGTVIQNCVIESDGTRSFSGAWTVPAAQVGEAHIRVTVNAERDLFEGSLTANNACTADTTSVLQLPELAVSAGAPVSFDLSAGANIAYRLGSTFADGGLLVVRSSVPISAWTGAGQVPTADIFYAGAVRVAEDVYLVQIPAGGESYVTVANDSPKVGEITIEAESGAFLLFETGVVTAPNVGTVTLNLYGNGFDADMTAYLEGNGKSVAAADVAVGDAVKAAVTFDVDGLPEGTYRVRLVKGGEEISAEALALTQQKVGPKWSGKMEIASVIRSGRVYTGTFTYGNAGDVALAAPYVALKASGDTLIRFSEADAWGDTLEFMAVSESAPASLVKPGETRRITFFYKTTGKSVSVTASTTTEDPKAFPWDTNGNYMRPSWATDEIWNRALATLKRNVGATWNDYLDRMRANCDHLQKIGTPTHRIDRLWQLEVNEALGVDHAVSALASGTDLARSGRGFGLSFSRSYGSGMYQRLRKGILGYGWSDNLSVSCELQENGTRFVIQSGNGSSYGFTKASGSWAPEDARDKTRMTESATEWTLTAQSGMVVKFSKSTRRLVSVRDNMGNGIDFTWDGVATESGVRGAPALPKLVRMTHTDGQWLAFTYEDDLLVSAADDQGRTTSYAYTGEMLTEVTAFNGRKVKYNYLPADDTAASRALRQIVAPDGQTKDFTYDAAGRVATASRNGSHFTSEIVRGELGSYSIIAPNGGVTAVTVGAGGETLATVNALGQKVQRTYTADTLLESVIAPSGKRSKIFYDTNGQAVKSMDAAGAATSFAYTEDFGSLKSVTDARQNAINYGYDKLGRSESVAYPDETSSRIFYAANGDVTNAVNAKGESIAYAYDKEGNKIRAVWPNGRIFAWAYDAKGNCTNASDSVTGAVTMEYDDKEQLTRITYPGNRGFTYAYDAYGRVTARTSLDGYAQKYEYDAFGRIAKMTDGAGNPYVANTYDPVTGNLILQTYGNGTVVSNAYDLLDRTVSITHRKADGSVLESFTYAYNEDGQRISLTTKEGVERYTYDAAGQVIGVVYPDGTEENFTYDAVGNRLATDEDTYTVNALNQYTSVRSARLSTGEAAAKRSLEWCADPTPSTPVGSAPRTDRDATFTYDLDGNLTSRTSAADGTTTYAYDCESRLIGVTNTLKGIAWSCEYDVFGNRVKVIDSGVPTTKVYTYGSLPSVAEEYCDGKLIGRHILIGAVRIADIYGTEIRYRHVDDLASTRLLTDANGEIAAKASYDAFGAILRSNGEEIKDGYIGAFSVETDTTGLLFMRNRYYNPFIGRFIQKDPIGLHGNDVNCYRYCWNQPTLYFDYSGCIVEGIKFLQVTARGAKAAGKGTKALKYASNLEKPVEAIEATKELSGVNIFAKGSNVGLTEAAVEQQVKGKNINTVGCFAPVPVILMGNEDAVDDVINAIDWVEDKYYKVLGAGGWGYIDMHDDQGSGPLGVHTTSLFCGAVQVPTYNFIRWFL